MGNFLQLMLYLVSFVALYWRTLEMSSTYPLFSLLSLLKTGNREKKASQQRLERCLKKEANYLSSQQAINTVKGQTIMRKWIKIINEGKFGIIIKWLHTEPENNYCY